MFLGSSLMAQGSGSRLAAMGPNPAVRVLVAETTVAVNLRPSGFWELSAYDGQSTLPLIAAESPRIVPRGRYLRLITTAAEIDHVRVLSHERVILRPADAQSTIALSEAGSPERVLEGELEFVLTPDESVKIVATLALESYLRGVVPSEIGADAPQQAKCAQAVAARSYAALALATGKHAADGYHLCSTVDCQVYSGLGRATPSTDDAIRVTRGQILTFEGEPIPAYYAALCGGHTEDIRNSWPERSSQRAYHNADRLDGPTSAPLDLTKEDVFRAWLASSPAVYCNPEKFQVLDWAGRNFRWKREFTAEEVSEFVAKKKDIGRIAEIRPVRRGKSGRLSEVLFVGEKGELSLGPELAIRRLFKPQLRSAAFAVETTGTAERPAGFVFSGAGSGHGVGMCQTGAMGMANAGLDFRQILTHYYPTAEVMNLY